MGCQINCQKCQNQLGGQLGNQFGSQNRATCPCANSICANQCYKCLNNQWGGFGNNCVGRKKRSPQELSTGQAGSNDEVNKKFTQCIQSNCNNCFCNDNNCQRYCQKCQIGGGIGNCLFKRSISKRSPQEVTTGGSSSSNAADTKFSLANCFNNGGFGGINGGFGGNNQGNNCFTCNCQFSQC